MLDREDHGVQPPSGTGRRIAVQHDGVARHAAQSRRGGHRAANGVRPVGDRDRDTQSMRADRGGQKGVIDGGAGRDGQHRWQQERGERLTKEMSHIPIRSAMETWQLPRALLSCLAIAATSESCDPRWVYLASLARVYSTTTR